MLPLTQALPDNVFRKIGKQLRDGVRSAVATYEDQRGDEDAVTGGLIQAIRSAVRGDATTFTTGSVSWRTRMWKLRGRGKGAPERTIGADAIFEIEVIDGDGVVTSRKSLPIQAKKEWDGSDRLLATQAPKLAALPGGGIVIDYRGQGYDAIDARTAADAKGNRRNVDPRAVRPLGDVLAGDFLECKVGSSDIYFDARKEVLLISSDGRGLKLVPFTAGYRVRTDVFIP